jgi:hypothetical protein
LDYERSCREEEARREAEEHRRISPRIDSEGRRGSDTSFDNERYGTEEAEAPE